DEDEIDLLEEWFDESNLRRRIDGEADFLAELSDFPNERVRGLAEFDVDGHAIGTGAGEWLEQALRLLTHEVNIKFHFARNWPNHAHNFGTEGNVLHEMTIHDVEVQPLGARILGTLCFGAEPAEVRGEQRGRNNHG